MLVRAPCPPLGPGEHDLPPELAHYLTRVLRLREGDTFVGFDGARAEEWDASLVTVRGSRARARFGEARPALRAVRAVAWVHGLPKGDKADAIVRDATELGATWVGFAAMEHAVVQLDAKRAEARHARWRRIAEEAARQCGRGDVPIVAPVAPLAAAIAAARAHGREGAGGNVRGFVLYEKAKTPLGPALREALAGANGLLFVAGPEGGFSESEIADAEAQGLETVGLGRRILRTETVPAAVLGAVVVGSGE